jgi:hypothetical protein
VTQTLDDQTRIVPARRGHFRLESGHHGELWLELELLLVRAVRRQARRSSERVAAWLVGRVGRGGRAWGFVSCVAGRSLPAQAAVEQATRGLAQAGVFAQTLP